MNLERASSAIAELRADSTLDQHYVDAISAFISERETRLS